MRSARPSFWKYAISASIQTEARARGEQTTISQSDVQRDLDIPTKVGGGCELLFIPKHTASRFAVGPQRNAFGIA